MNVIIQPVNGLFNRLRAMISSFILAKHLGRKIIVIWNKEQGTNCNFTDLYDAHPDIEVRENIGFDYSNCDYFAGNSSGEQPLVDAMLRSQRDIFIKAGGNFRIYPIQEHNNWKSWWYNQLKPKAEILEAASKYDLSSTLGVHIRLTDRAGCMPALQDVDNKYVNTAMRNYNKLYLTTDNMSIIPFFKKYNLIFYPKQEVNLNRSASNLEIMKIALIDWVLLSRCNKIIYSYDSSYSYEACFPNKLSGSVEIELQHKRAAEVSPLHSINILPLIF